MTHVTVTDDVAPAPAGSPESEAHSVLAEYAAEVNRRMSAALVGKTGDDLVRCLSEEVEALRAAIADPALVQGVTAAANPPRFDRKGRIRIDTNPVLSHRNPVAPPMTLVRDGKECAFTVVLPLQYQGPPGSLHGGYFAVLLDEVLWYAVRQNVAGISFTRELTVSYERPVPLFKEITITGRVTSVDGRKSYAEGEILADGEICARGTGLWIAPKPRPHI
ncbi:PaaI family thioesterase [Pseudarthrobacter sulfonivorans]|uniref:PaaI family thioesterase n=1 Tax=Pseudarthrobacter sulfonivorans TaxID=121292 RepID=UPI0027872938|nr:PaaI family thioesterase [Pseudarthrobacter sulfonivorans]MDP9998457.1 acyl-coenzyme A thioesterase PaaI-like protein [Pseudarthrobacter sulfonivorans]